MGPQSRTDRASELSTSLRAMQGICRCFSPDNAACGFALLLLLFVFSSPAVAQTSASVPLILPGGLAYDAQGNLYFTETGLNVVRRLAPGGTLSTIAGSSIQGFAGDGGPATAADFDSPQAVALDTGGNLLIADTHNHRIRRVDALTGTVRTVADLSAPSGNGPQAGLPTALAVDASGAIYFADAAQHRIRRIDPVSGALSTIAGNGVQGYSGDGGLAVQAAIDSPYGIALDPQGDLFLADTHNHCIRRVDHATGTITTIAGSGQPGFSGDSSPAGSALLRLPRGLALDQNGNLYVVDSGNQRLRRIDGVSGQIVTVAGEGTEGYGGDSGAATSASLDGPRGVALSPAGLAAFSDTGNQGIRQVSASGTIHTIAGPGFTGGTGASELELTVSASPVYGSGQAVARVTGGPATGSVTLFQTTFSGPPQQLASAPLIANAATFSLATLPAGVDRLSAAYGGDSGHVATQSVLVPVTISPLGVTAVPNAAATVFGAPVPLLTGSLAGVLPQDEQTVTLVLSSPASSSIAPGAYPITGLLSGPAAGNYLLAVSPAAVTVSKAAAATTLSPALTVHVASSTTGIPAGQVTLIDGATSVQTASLNASGDAAFSASALSAGSHTLTAAYTGNADFLSASSMPVVLSTLPASQADFTLASLGQSSASIVAGGTATFSFAVAPVQGALNSPIQLSAAGLPAGASASFSPAYLPPGAAPASFTLTIQTLKTAARNGSGPKGARFNTALVTAFALALPLLVGRRRRGLLARAALLGVCGSGLVLLNGCGSRTNPAGASASTQVYTVSVIATAASDSGAKLTHAATVSLSVQ